MSERAAIAAVKDLQASAHRIFTDGPESDGTVSWVPTTLIVVHGDGGDQRGMGYTHGGWDIPNLWVCAARGEL